MRFREPTLLRDDELSLLQAEGKRPVARFVRGDEELRDALRHAMPAKARALAEATDERVLADAADFATVFRAFLKENGIADRELADIAAQDGHTPPEFIAHAEELSRAGYDKLVGLSADMRRSFENFCAAAGIAGEVLQEEVDRLLRERGGYERGVLLEYMEESGESGRNGQAPPDAGK